MRILAIETSCDETAAAILEDGKHLLSNVVVSQVDIFKHYGGVIPEVAARSHLEAILPVIDQAFADAGFIENPANSPSSLNPSKNPTFQCKSALSADSAKSASSFPAQSNDWSKIDAIAVTHTPGLLGSLLIGTLTARTLAILHGKPLYPIHHLKSHIYANWLSGEPPQFPLLALVISGGHTQIIFMPSHNHFEIIGTTLDDAVGECFDKVAKILGLPYPGGPSISKAALSGNPRKYRFPHPKTENPLDFSFSGLKTAVLRAVQKELNLPISFPSHDLAPLLSPQQVADFAASFEQTAVDILLEKLSLAHSLHPSVKSLVFAGGVSANKRLKSAAQASTFFPSPQFSGDNAAMVAMAAHWEIASGVEPTDPYKLTLSPRSTIS